MPGNSTINLKAALENYGVNRRNVHLFRDSASPELLDYLDLVKPDASDDTKKLLPDGVAENQGRPLLFFVNESRLSQTPGEQETKLAELRRNLACRGDRAYLAVVRPGTLDVVPVTLTDRTPEWKTYDAGTGEALTFFSRLALGHYDGKGAADDSDFIFKEMFKLLQHGANRLAHVLGRTNVLSLLGRALFFRFLCDRHIVTERDTKRIASNAEKLHECFDTAENAYETSQWLDRTFNGDFLPLKDGGSHAYFDNIKERSTKAFSHLSAIVQGLEPVGAEDYQGRLNWGDFNFAHVPVGLLSQVYEAFSWKWEHESAKETSVHYTPRNIAATLVDEAFDGLPDANKARVLDPACGAGVFLVLAFRRLYRERWKAQKTTDQRPDTKTIREILEKQLVGFDISDSALKLSALSLYLTAIELDPKPVPPEKLRFKELKNLVLFNHRRENVDPDEGPVIGSLGEHVGDQFNGQFHLLLSNPPWTSLTDNALANQIEAVSCAVIERKDEALAKNYENPDNGPDLPFLWKSTEWCKVGGRIAMALPARILLKQEAIPRRARETMFRLIEVTGIINGSNLRKTKVWPEMDQPFILLFARNRRPKAGHTLTFVNSHADVILNRTGQMRIDSNSSEPVATEATFDAPWLWKALSVGTALDVQVVQQIKSINSRPLLDYWLTDLHLHSSAGYSLKKDVKEPKSAEAIKRKEECIRFLNTLKDLRSLQGFRFIVRTEELDDFRYQKIGRPREKEIYRAPLALVCEVPSADPNDVRALLSFEDLAYKQSFYGYSAAGHKDADTLIRYLQLFVHSQVWLHYALLTNFKLGAERPHIFKSDLDECPFIPLENLSKGQHQTIHKLSQRLLDNDVTVFADIDTFIIGLYGLTGRDLGVIRDTLEVRNPHDELGVRASTPPGESERELFRTRLESCLRPFFNALEKEPKVILWKPDDAFLRKNIPFRIILIGEQSRVVAEPESLFRSMILDLAKDTGTTRIIQEVKGGLLVGILDQYRYWTPSRARLLGAEIVRQRMALFED